MIGVDSGALNEHLFCQEIDDKFVNYGPIQVINSLNPIEMGKFSISDEDSVISVEFSQGGELMAAISMSGQVKIWQVLPQSEQSNWPLLRVLRDEKEENLDEFFTGAFLPNGNFVVAGKRKHRHRWDERVEEAQSLPGLLKIFDLRTGKCVQRFADGHIDEILYLKLIRSRKGGNFIVSCGLDGRISRWSFSDDWNTFKGVQFVKLGNLSFHFDHMSDELIAVAVDNGLIIFDIINFKHIRAFKTGFTSYCDFVKVSQRNGNKFQFILRGVELLKTDTQQPSAPNSIIMTEVDLSKPSSARIISRLRHPLYNANSWLIKPGITFNGVYLAAPTITGRVLIFNLKTKEITANLHAHDDSEVRHVVFHERLPLMVSCGDDGRVRIYFSKHHRDFNRLWEPSDTIPQVTKEKLTEEVLKRFHHQLG